MKWPEKMKTNSVRHDKIKYYRFHNYYDHEIDDYCTLKDVIEFLLS